MCEYSTHMFGESGGVYVGVMSAAKETTVGSKTWTVMVEFVGPAAPSVSHWKAIKRGPVAGPGYVWHCERPRGTEKNASNKKRKQRAKI